ncbi:MAG: sigma-70 family RNA polymerase sigma factor [Planctomycetota bacterium]|nr:MAG: sigma-70 family RNA polymerase sigma factor [Planctomycetota bacterium]
MCRNHSELDTPAPDITGILSQIRAGDTAAQRDLFDAVYAELRRISRRQMRREDAAHLLQTTALVHEAYLRLVEWRDLGSLENRTHFFAVAARVMRNILTEHARRRDAQKRGGAYARVPLDEVLDSIEQSDRVCVLDLDAALDELAALDRRQAEIIELRTFAGLSSQAIADLLGLSKSTIDKSQRSARAWLHARLSDAS